MVSALVFLSFWLPVTFADDATRFTVEADRDEISADESVSLKFNIESSGVRTNSSDPEFTAPDFDFLNSYESSHIQSLYENGRFQVKNIKQRVIVLRPKREGKLKIDGFKISIDGKSYQASPIEVTVTPGGQGTPPPQRYGGVQGLRGTGKRLENRSFLVRAEVNKQQAYKGEQIIVSYYLYRRSRVYNIRATEFPELQGFLKEDLQNALGGGTLRFERANLDGVPYDRALLVRYAAYPLQEGKLTIDTLSIQAHYYPDQSSLRMDDEGDVFFQFFNQSIAQTAIQKSEPVIIEAISLPKEGRLSGFTGGVGDFDVNASLSRNEAQAGESVSLLVKVEGRGNVSTVELPKIDPGAAFDVYETKGRSSSSVGGVGEKTFEVLLIPREEGLQRIPPIEFVFFDPATKTYVTKSTPVFDLRVLPGDPTLAVRPTQKNIELGTKTPRPEQEDLRYLKLDGPNETSPTPSMLKYFLPVGGALFLLFWIGVLLDQLRHVFLRSRKKMAKEPKSWQPGYWKSIAREAGTLSAHSDASAWKSISAKVEDGLFDVIDGVYKIRSRGLPRSELERILVTEKGLIPEIWGELNGVLVFTEWARFALRANDTDLLRVREELPRQVEICGRLIRTLSST